jgi:hypothetical protein
MVRRDDDALILEFEFARKKYKLLFKEPGQPHEVRIPLHEIASLSYGWGWGKPPRSVVLKVRRLVALVGIPGSGQGRVHLFIPREDRAEARALVESIMGTASANCEQGSAGSLPSVDQARQEVAMPAMGLLATGVVALFSWLLIGVTVVGLWLQPHPGDYRMSDTLFWPLLIAAGSLIGALASVQIMGAVMLRRLRCYPCAATAAILATVPWSLGWLIGLPFGILAIIVLGRPEVVEGFLSDTRQAGSGPPGARKPGARVASRLLSLLRSVGRYMLPTMPGQKTAVGVSQDAPPSTIKSPVPGANVNYPGEAR